MMYTHMFFSLFCFRDVCSWYRMVVTMALPKLTMYMSTTPRNFLAQLSWRNSLLGFFHSGNVWWCDLRFTGAASVFRFWKSTPPNSEKWWARWYETRQNIQILLYSSYALHHKVFCPRDARNWLIPPGPVVARISLWRNPSLCGRHLWHHLKVILTMVNWSTIDQTISTKQIHTHGGASGTAVICGQFIRILQGDSKSHHWLKVAAVHSLELWLPLATSMQNSDVLKSKHVWTIWFKHVIWAISTHIYGSVTGQQSKNAWKQRNHWNSHWHRVILHYLDSLLSPCQVLRSSDEKSCRERYGFWIPYHLHTTFSSLFGTPLYC